MRLGEFQCGITDREHFCQSVTVFTKSHLGHCDSFVMVMVKLKFRIALCVHETCFKVIDKELLL